MEYVIGILLGVLGLLYYKFKHLLADKELTDTKIQDAKLETEEMFTKEKIQELQKQLDEQKIPKKAEDMSREEIIKFWKDTLS